MRIDANLTLHAARAYRPTPGPVGAAVPAAKAASPERGAAKIGGVSPLLSLVAGRAVGGVDFERASVPASGGVLQLYTRAADKVEAAVAVQLGRSLDVRA